MGIILPADSIDQTYFPFLLGLLHDRSGNCNFGLLVVIALAVEPLSLLARKTV